jgi:hypothetical protein
LISTGDDSYLSQCCSLSSGLWVNRFIILIKTEKEMNTTKETPWPESASELYRPSDRRLSAKLVPTLADRVCHVVSATNPHGR